MIYRTLLFLLINFGALALGGLFTSKGVPSDWYESLNKAPWTPPGWMFGAAWTLIMICFSFYMAYVVKDTENLKLPIVLFSIQWILNVSWNPAFFYFHHVSLALVIIVLLTLLVAFLLFYFWSTLGLKSLFILPYLLWLLIATSLNAYILVNN